MQPKVAEVAKPQGVATKAGVSVSAVIANSPSLGASPQPATPPDACSAAMRRVWPKEQWNNAEVIMGRESGLKPLAINYNSDGSIDRGCFQVNSVHKDFDQAKLFDPNYNAYAALMVFQGAGWRAWTTAQGLLW